MYLLNFKFHTFSLTTEVSLKMLVIPIHVQRGIVWPLAAHQQLSYWHGGGRRVCMMREGYMYAHTQIKMHRIFIFLALVLLFHVVMRQPCNSQNAQPRVQQSLLVYYGPCTHVSIGDDN